MTRRTKSLIIILSGSAVMWSIFAAGFLTARERVSEMGKARRFFEAYTVLEDETPTLEALRARMDSVHASSPEQQEGTEQLYRQLALTATGIDSLKEHLFRLDDPTLDGAAGFELLCAKGGADDLIAGIRYVLYHSEALSTSEHCTARLRNMRSYSELDVPGPQWCDRVFRDVPLDEQAAFLDQVKLFLIACVRETVMSHAFPDGTYPVGGYHRFNQGQEGADGE